MNNKQITFLDVLNVVSFYIGLLNLNENLTQGDKQELMEKFDRQINELLKDMHEHLHNQDVLLKEILEELKEVKRNDSL